MTRFDATDERERSALFGDAIDAHRERGSPYLTVEVDESHLGTSAESSGDEVNSLDPELGVPWIQFAEDTCNLDCTDEELDRLKDVLGEFPAFSIAELTRPDDAEGTNVRVEANADSARVVQFVEATFRRVYGLPEDYRAWVVEV